MRFSERIGKKKPKCGLQIESMDTDLKNGLWNILYILTIDKIRKQKHIGDRNRWEGFIKALWYGFFNLPLDEIVESNTDRVKKYIKEWFFNAQWYEVYDFLEFVAKLKGPIDTNRFKRGCNEVLERELSGYRFVGDEVAPITNKIEVNEIEKALETSAEHNLKGVHKHLESALDKLSDRENPDYRNSIKESISSVESLCIIISKDKKATLGQALKKIEDTVGLHPALKSGFNSIYGYTSDEGGIRHAMIDDPNCDFDDAKYMLVSCSAFVNYLIMKASKAGLIDQD
jgi:hypothetical protein